MKIQRIESVLSTGWRSDWMPDDDRLPPGWKRRRYPSKSVDDTDPPSETDTTT